MSFTRITIAIVAASGLAVTGALVGGGAAAAASDTEAFHIALSNSSYTVAAHGVFDATGSDIAHSQKDVLVFTDGALTIYHPNADSTLSFRFNPATCTLRTKIVGSYTLGNGKRAYAGVTGSGMYRGSGRTVFAKTGAGTCDYSADPLSVTLDVHASGPISFATD